MKEKPFEKIRVRITDGAWKNEMGWITGPTNEVGGHPISLDSGFNLVWFESEIEIAEETNKEEKTYTIKQIADYISGWASGPFESVEQIGKAVLLNSLNQLEDEQDGIEAFTVRVSKPS